MLRIIKYVSEMFLVLIAFFLFVSQVIEQKNIMIPATFINTSDEEVQSIKGKLVSLGAVKQVDTIAVAVYQASQNTGVKSDFLIALMFTESRFKQHAVSSMNYKGLMQIPYAVWQPDANTLIGAHTFKEKWNASNGNLKNAICKYKGHSDVNSEGCRAQAGEVIQLYTNLVAK